MNGVMAAVLIVAASGVLIIALSRPLKAKSLREWRRRYEPVTERYTGDPHAWSRSRIDTTYYASLVVLAVGAALTGSGLGLAVVLLLKGATS